MHSFTIKTAYTYANLTTHNIYSTIHICIYFTLKSKNGHSWNKIPNVPYFKTARYASTWGTAACWKHGIRINCTIGCLQNKLVCDYILAVCITVRWAVTKLVSRSEILGCFQLEIIYGYLVMSIGREYSIPYLMNYISQLNMAHYGIFWAVHVIVFTQK